MSKKSNQYYMYKQEIAGQARKDVSVKSGIFIVILLCLTAGLTAQNTGYMGKRVIVNMGAEFSPAWMRPISYNPKFQYEWYSFNYILSPGIEIITHKTGTAGIVYHYLSTKYNTPSEESFFSYENIVEDLTSHGFGVFYKQYMRFADGRAPVGPYISLQFDGFFFKCPSSYDDRTTTTTDKLFAMKIEIVNDFLLFNRLRLSTGFSFGLPFGGFSGLHYDNELFEIISDNANLPINQYARSRILGAYWLGFTVGIGFLAF